MAFLEKIINVLQEEFRKLNGEEKKRLTLIFTAVAVAILVLSVFLSLENVQNNEIIIETGSLNIINPIPAQEIFLPNEPDFLPGVLLGREQRTEWTEQDVMDFWQDPLREGEQQWRDIIEAVKNELLESVP